MSDEEIIPTFREFIRFRQYVENCADMPYEQQIRMFIEFKEFQQLYSTLMENSTEDAVSDVSTTLPPQSDQEIASSFHVANACSQTQGIEANCTTHSSFAHHLIPNSPGIPHFHSDIGGTDFPQLALQDHALELSFPSQAMEECDEDLNSHDSDEEEPLNEESWSSIHSQFNFFHGRQLTPQILKTYLDDGFSVPIIASLTGRPVIYVRRMMKKNNLLCRIYSSITDDQLDDLVRRTLQLFPNIGTKYMMGYIRSLETFDGQRLKIQRSRLRDSYKRVLIQAGVAPLIVTPIKRRVYHVKAPLSLWHIDGHHKLIRWRFVAHGGIDGFSRLIVFLKISDNNKAETVLKEFQLATRSWGIPCRVRSDHGGENVRVCDYVMYANNSENSFVTGRSVHNQRIERFWNDFYCRCLDPFHFAFSELERLDLLNPSCDIDIWCLHYTVSYILPRTVKCFQDMHNNHSLSTEHSLSPLQLFRGGLRRLAQVNEEDSSDDEIDRELQQDVQRIVGAEQEMKYVRLAAKALRATRRQRNVNVPAIQCPLNLQDFRRLQTTIDPQTITLSNLIPSYRIVKDLVCGST